MLTEIRISRSALLHNVKNFRNVIRKRAQFMAVVKSNAYGHGVGECAPILAKHDVDWFGVASVKEALQLKKYVPRKPILVLSYIDGTDAELVQAIRSKIRLPLYDLAMLRRLDKIAQRAKQPALIHVKFDTGTSRIGFLPNALPEIIQRLQRCKHVYVEGAFSHFAEVESQQQAFTMLQQKRFSKLSFALEAALKRSILKHLDCSAGVLLQPESHFDMVRVGMSLYGIHTVLHPERLQAMHPTFRLQPVLSWYTKVIQRKVVSAGTTIGYNRTYQTRHRAIIATLPIGYWDGYDRRLSNRGQVYFGRTACPVRGRVCMNLMMVESTRCPKLDVGDTVELLGPQIPLPYVASLCKTIPYEIVTRLNPLIRRVVTA